MKPISAMALFFMVLYSSAWGAQPDAPDYSGQWDVTASFAEGTASAVLTLSETGGRYTGSSGPLDAIGALPLQYSGTLEGPTLVLTLATIPLLPESVGTLRLNIAADGLRGNGALYREPVAVTATRRVQMEHQPRTYDYVPTRYFTRLSAATPPVLRVYPGDSVRTSTLDANGQDEKHQWASMPGNPVTGPFYVEGAMPGDTLVIHLTRVRPNQTRAGMVCWTLNARALPSGTAQLPPSPCSFFWNLDAQKGVATPSNAGDRLKNFKVALRPMIGTIGVAPPSNQSIGATYIGSYGGNLDYNRMTEGVSLYLPVYQAGALLYLGDAHAAQGDGEITGQGLETSMAVEFKVDLIKGSSLGMPWLEDDEYVMVSGIGHSLNEALQAGTGGMLEWLKQKYRLEMSDAALILGTSIDYDVASVLGMPHVVAKVRKDVLAQIVTSEPSPQSN
jgi:acetamidase/formamidase